MAQPFNRKAEVPKPGELDRKYGEFWVTNPWNIESEGHNLSAYERKRAYLNVSDPDGGRNQSSHDLGGARMGEDPAASVVDRDLQVHDTPGLYVFGGATFPTAHGVNPHLTIEAVTARASEQLVRRLS